MHHLLVENLVIKIKAQPKAWIEDGVAEAAYSLVSLLTHRLALPPHPPVYRPAGPHLLAVVLRSIFLMRRTKISNEV
jgi:hypothetical protein